MPEQDDLADGLLERWLGLFPAGRSAAASRVFGFMLLGYLSGQRHYHNLEHLAACLRELDEARPSADDARALELGLYFHDAICEARAAGNEKKSAELARLSLLELGEEQALAEKVAQLVLATKHDAPGASADERLIADIDLSILGQPEDLFDAYDRAIRGEYGQVPEDVYRAGRRAVLEQFLARQRIYLTDHFHERYEAMARKNLRRACARLI
jgi:predicted metal-dependent HD superfamily phosphohydrolase